MPLVRIKNIGAVGIVKDIPPHELPPEAWNDGNNIRFQHNRVEKMSGEQDVYNITVSAATASQAIAEAPWFALPVYSGTNLYWVYAGKNNVHVATVDSNSTNINKLDTTASATVEYSSTPNVRWNGANLGRVAVLNNWKIAPQVWDSPSLATRLVDMQWDTSASAGGPVSWTDRTAGAVTCKVFRTYREFGIAMYTEEGGTTYPRRLRWSHPSTGNDQPPSWDDTRTDMDAGYKDFNETGDFIVDGRQLRDLFIIYKEQSTWVMQYIGGRYVQAFRPLFSNVGALSRDCIIEFEGKHIVLTPSDVVLHDAQTIQSVIHARWRDWLFNAIDSSYYENSFLAINHSNHEIWICFPQTGTSTPYWCDTALIYNWKYNTYTVRDLTRAAYIANGLVPFGQSGAATLTWDSYTGEWDSATGEWNQRGFSNAERNMLLCQAENTVTVSASSTATPKLLRLDSTSQFDGNNFTSYVQREGLAIGSQDRQGRPVVDLQSIKHVRAIWPYFEANNGVTIGITVGSQNDMNEAITWYPEQTFTVGTDRKINCRVMGRYIAIRFRTIHGDHWELTGYDMDVDKTGWF